MYIPYFPYQPTPVIVCIATISRILSIPTPPGLKPSPCLALWAIISFQPITVKDHSINRTLSYLEFLEPCWCEITSPRITPPVLRNLAGPKRLPDWPDRRNFYDRVYIIILFFRHCRWSPADYKITISISPQFCDVGHSSRLYGNPIPDKDIASMPAKKKTRQPHQQQHHHQHIAATYHTRSRGN